MPLPEKRRIADNDERDLRLKLSKLRPDFPTVNMQPIGVTFRERRERHKRKITTTTNNNTLDDTDLSVLSFDSNTTFGKFDHDGLPLSQFTQPPTTQESLPDRSPAPRRPSRLSMPSLFRSPTPRRFPPSPILFRYSPPPSSVSGSEASPPPIPPAESPSTSTPSPLLPLPKHVISVHSSLSSAIGHPWVHSQDPGVSIVQPLSLVSVNSSPSVSPPPRLAVTSKDGRRLATPLSPSPALHDLAEQDQAEKETASPRPKEPSVIVIDKPNGQPVAEPPAPAPVPPATSSGSMVSAGKKPAKYAMMDFVPTSKRGSKRVIGSSFKRQWIDSMFDKNNGSDHISEDAISIASSHHEQQVQPTSSHDQHQPTQRSAIRDTDSIDSSAIHLVKSTSVQNGLTAPDSLPETAEQHEPESKQAFSTQLSSHTDDAVPPSSDASVVPTDTGFLPSSQRKEPTRAVGPASPTMDDYPNDYPIDDYPDDLYDEDLPVHQTPAPPVQQQPQPSPRDSSRVSPPFVHDFNHPSPSAAHERVSPDVADLSFSGAASDDRDSPSTTDQQQRSTSPAVNTPTASEPNSPLFMVPPSILGIPQPVDYQSSAQPEASSSKPSSQHHVRSVESMEVPEPVPPTSPTPPLMTYPSGPADKGKGKAKADAPVQDPSPPRAISGLFDDDLMDFMSWHDDDDAIGLEQPSPSHHVKQILDPKANGTQRLLDHVNEESRVPVISNSKVRSIFNSFMPRRIIHSGNSMGALQQVSDLFFEQVCQDLEDYANHAGRTVITDDDIKLLMKRQRLVTSNANLEALAHEHLPRELWDLICVSALADNFLYPLHRE